ncbi:cation-transporting P-type ATPase [Streptomyces sp. NBC_00063]|uniref:cation-translocating P-type ATPase n=1 Tax=Streptomyces sp. NBC_00063 TaxID=2975638 RepID=UPI002254D951|nr:cation-transporting P-type ATPase [Streptomyces sp. NBC_00063]MCX5435313.1 cation-transporting P-type ATPase [Streptomyces sp. NBC_00063]
MPAAQQAPAPAVSRRGLTEAEAARRLAEYGRNEVAAARAAPLYARVLTQLRDALILVLLGAVVLTLAIGDHADAVVIALVIVVNTAVGVAQEVRADNAVAALSALSAPNARVLRDFASGEVPAAEVAPGDVLILGEGDIVAADAELAEASALLVDESMLTGESVSVDKDPGARLSAGTVVVRGRGVATVTATGADSALGRIAAQLGGKREPTPLQRRLGALGRVLAAVTLALCLVVFVLGVVRGVPVATMAVTAISLAVAAVPESLPAVVTLALALGARRMADRHALVRRLPAVETLGSVTVLATDKTGTLTEGRMVVQHVWTPRRTFDFFGVGYEPEGDVQVEGKRPTTDELEPARELLTVTCLCNDARLRPPQDSADKRLWSAVGDPMEAALLAAAAKAGCADRAGLVGELPRRDESPFDSVRKRMSTLHMTPSGQVIVCLKGAPEVVLDTAVLGDTTDLIRGARQEAALLAAQGYRVLAVASGTRDDVPSHPAEAESGLRLLGLVAISDPPKAHATATLAACRAAGITPVLITGDHPATARAIAKRVGLVNDDHGQEHVITGPDLAAGRVADLTTVRVFARTTPQQKLDIVEAWRSHGEITAMTGDGVNDGPALRQADIGVAMGRRGTEVARQAADLVLADDELAIVVAAVEEGRRVYDNIRRFLVYGLAGGTAEILVMLVGPLLGLPLPLRAGQILWINLLTHGLTGVAMGAEPVAPGAMHRPPRPPGQQILADGAWQRLLFLAGVVAASSLGAGVVAQHSGLPWQSVLFLALLASQLGVVLGLRTRLLTRQNFFLPLSVLASVLLAGAALYIPFLQSVLETEPLGWSAVGLAAIAAVTGCAAARLSRAAFHARHQSLGTLH